MERWKRQNFINSLKKLYFNGLISMGSCQKICFNYEMKTSQRPVQWRRVSHVTYIRPVTQLEATLRRYSNCNLAGFCMVYLRTLWTAQIMQRRIFEEMETMWRKMWWPNLRYYTYSDLPEGTEHEHERLESRKISGTRYKPGTSQIRNRTAIFGGTIG
jgi:hypothetical protein